MGLLQSLLAYLNNLFSGPILYSCFPSSPEDLNARVHTEPSPKRSFREPSHCRLRQVAVTEPSSDLPSFDADSLYRAVWFSHADGFLEGRESGCESAQAPPAPDESFAHEPRGGNAFSRTFVDVFVRIPLSICSSDGWLQVYCVCCILASFRLTIASHQRFQRFCAVGRC
jgi:hypothetical protein